MSAAELFVSAYDVEFRLLKTHIIVGKLPLFIRQIENSLSHCWWQTRLICQTASGNLLAPRLDQLPLSSMWNCPQGYYQGLWYGRGPARHRHQGLKPWSWWTVFMDGSISSSDVDDPMRLITNLLSQPIIRENKKALKGVLTRDVAITPIDDVLIRGISRGRHLGRGKVAINPNTPQFLRKFLDNARLDWYENVGEPETAAKEPSFDNPCNEILIEPVPTMAMAEETW